MEAVALESLDIKRLVPFNLTRNVLDPMHHLCNVSPELTHSPLLGVFIHGYVCGAGSEALNYCCHLVHENGIPVSGCLLMEKGEEGCRGVGEHP